MKRYISKAERNLIITIDALASQLVVHAVPQADKMGKEVATRFRTAATHLKKGLSSYMDTLDPNDRKRLLHESGTTNVILTSHAYRPKDETDEKMQIIWGLAERAIGKECTGCTKDGETCELKHLLALADVPYATTEPENCPYELPSLEVAQ